MLQVETPDNLCGKLLLTLGSTANRLMVTQIGCERVKSDRMNAGVKSTSVARAGSISMNPRSQPPVLTRLSRHGVSKMSTARIPRHVVCDASIQEWGGTPFLEK